MQRGVDCQLVPAQPALPCPGQSCRDWGVVFSALNPRELQAALGLPAFLAPPDPTLPPSLRLLCSPSSPPSAPSPYLLPLSPTPLFLCFPFSAPKAP